MDADDWIDAMVCTWAVVVGFAMGATLALQFGGLVNHYFKVMR